jgi:plastocyanin
MRYLSSGVGLLLGALLVVGCGTSSSGTSDAATAGAGGGGGDAGVFTAIAPCAAVSSYMTGATTIMTTANFTYSPACLKVAAGSSVTIEASAVHPLSGLATGSANNPIPAGGKTADQMVTFPTPGFYPFHCDVHFAIGMSGVVWVQ